MKKTIIYFTLFAIVFSCQNKKENSAQKLSNQLGNAVLWYQNSAEMEAIYQQAYDKGKMLLDIKLDTLDSTLSPAIILDLDETVLDNSPYEARLLKSGENYSSDTWKAWCREANAKALPGAEKFLAYANLMNVDIFYVSNRSVDVFDATLQNLQKLELPQAKEDHLLLKTTTSDKTERRSKIQSEHEVLLYFGDNLTDYSQDFAHRENGSGKAKLEALQEEVLHNFIAFPNPMYGEWESAIYDNDYSLSDKEKLNKRNEALITE